jgi:hypothetical protein
MTQRVLGSTVSLWRYPVKSVMGSDGTIVSSEQSDLDQIFTKMFNRDEIFRVGRSAKVYRGVLAGYRRPRENSLMGHSLNTQQVDSGDGKNIEVVTDES